MPASRPTLALATDAGLGPRTEGVVTLIDLAGWRIAESALDADVGLVVGRFDLEPPDDWVRTGLPHLAVAVGAQEARVGPFVAPGLTPCVRCVVEHERPARGGPSVAGAAGTLPVLVLALGWALLDLDAWRAGRSPATWAGTTLDVGASGVVARRVWPRHPHCGCGWGLAG